MRSWGMKENKWLIVHWVDQVVRASLLFPWQREKAPFYGKNEQLPCTLLPVAFAQMRKWHAGEGSKPPSAYMCAPTPYPWVDEALPVLCSRVIPPETGTRLAWRRAEFLIKDFTSSCRNLSGWLLFGKTERSMPPCIYSGKQRWARLLFQSGPLLMSLRGACLGVWNHSCGLCPETSLEMT